ncbi:hypothetical protein AAFF_G00346740 [Aldrovandia affinis]|uniref:DUF2028 domain-containing protein n=1 Tax=Aldrovandia affinis TaxID=143900 RepID=A0AAD7SLT2_9TELE|nr:hypothetical protein AAFF_G00346740 [Aldrovandia affinis]
MADPTKMGGLSMLLLAGEHALTAREISSRTSPVAADSTKQSGRSDLGQPAEVTSGTRQPTTMDKPTDGKDSQVNLSQISPGAGTTDPPKACVNPPPVDLPKISSSSQPITPEGRQCGQSALFQLAEMCLASEARKTETTAPQPGDQTPTAPPRGRGSAPTIQPRDATKKKKKKKKRRREDGGGAGEDGGGAGEGGSACAVTKACRRSVSSEPDLESLVGTIDAVAKGSWGAGGDRDEGPQDEPRLPIGPSSPNRKCRPKIKKEEAEEEEETHGPVALPGGYGEGEEPNVKTEASASADETPALLSPSTTPPQSEEKSVAKLESCGSRKSERTCKGALYKTLVSEGMLTSLRANVDRGRRGSGRGSVSDLEGSWADESWALAQPGTNNAKKLKKSKSKDESAPGRGKLEEEFERKFNSLPQYSPLSLDRKGACVAKKKKKSCGNGSEDPPRPPKPSRGSSPSQKKNLFHKIVSKHKHRKEQPSTVEKAIATPTVTALHTAPRAKEAGPCAPLLLEGPGGAETLVGSQKRKARKRKITHLVRTADGRVSPAAEDGARELAQGQEVKPSSPKSLCKEDRAVTAVTTVTSDRPGVSGLPPFLVWPLWPKWQPWRTCTVASTPPACLGRPSRRSWPRPRSHQQKSIPMIVLAIDKLDHPAVRVSVVKEGVLPPENHLQVGLVACGLLLDSPPRMI